MFASFSSLKILTAEPEAESISRGRVVSNDQTSPGAFHAAAAEIRSWSRELATSLSNWPIEWHLTHTEQQARELAANIEVQLCVLDQALPGVGGLELLRCFRRLGFRFPCVLVCDDAAPSLLKEALALEVFSVVEADRQRELLVPTVVRMVRNSFPSNGYADAAFN